MGHKRTRQPGGQPLFPLRQTQSLQTNCVVSLPNEAGPGKMAQTHGRGEGRGGGRRKSLSFEETVNVSSMLLSDWIFKRDGDLSHAYI